jgi:uncharacterized protein (TIGR02466 family)
MKKFNNIIQEPIFSSFVFSTELEIDLTSVKDECLRMEDIESGVINSNKGGFHSKISDFNDSKYPVLKNLKNLAQEFSNYVCNEIQISERVSRSKSWVNINRNSNYNVMHCHNENLLTGVFYVKVPKIANSNLILYRGDGAEYFNRAFSGDFVVTPVEGRLYIFSPWLKHSVDVNESTEERISIAFNFYSEPINE